LVLLVGANPRFEASSFNVNLRRLVLRGAAAISIGYPTDPTYKKSHFGNGMGLLAKLAAGKGPASLIRNIIFANRPVAVFGFENVRREDSNALAMLLNPVFQLRLRFFFEDVDGDGSIFLNSEGDASRFALRLRHSLRRSFKPKHSLVYEGYVNCESTIPTPVEINMLHINASTPGACEVGGIGDIGYVENIRGYPDGPDGLDAPSNCLYLIGADSDKSFVSTENLRTPMCIYQGHHGDIGAKRATVILPSTAYSEKNGTYISLYHRIQQTKAAVQHCGEARDDCKIIQALADILFQPSLSHIVESSSTWPSFFSVPLSVDRVSAREPLTLEATLCSATATLPICDFSPAIDDPYGEAKALSTSSISLAHDVPPENS
jgi:NADH-quinone oxidoreductase subunit G